MSQEEIRKLIGGYATGTLTEPQRKALFAAALDDQDLFDELAREQALKELLDSPGARTRLTAALAPPERALPANRFHWAIGGMLAAGFALALGLVLVVVRNPRPQDLAAVPKTESRPALDDLSKATSEPPPAPANGARIPSSTQAVNQPAPLRRQSPSTTVAPLPPPVLLEPPPEDALKKAEPARRDEPAKQDTGGPAQAEKSAADKPAAGQPAADKSIKDEKDAALPRPQPQAQAVQVQSAPSAVGRQQQAAESVTVTAAAPAIATNGLGITAPALRGRPAGIAGKVGATRFAFDYTIRRDSLTVNPLAAGFLQVTAATTGGQQIIVQAPSRQEAGTSVTLPVPAGSLNLTIGFSSRPAVQDLAASLQNLQKSRFREKTASPAVAPAISKDQTGHVEEQTPTADPRISITVAVPAE